MVDIIGQWIGTVKGTNEGAVTLNVEFKDPFRGRAMFADYSSPILSSCARAVFKITDTVVNGELSEFMAIDVNTSLLVKAEILNKQNLGYTIPTSGEINGILDDWTIAGSWKTNIGTGGNFTLHKGGPVKYTEPDKKMGWSDFKNWVSANIGFEGKVIYRGQNISDGLRTSFHRTERNDLVRYWLEDLPTLVHFINAISNHPYNPLNFDDLGALLNLIQHHGYPTPLLDWTESPFVASYFAYENTRKNETEGYVRIFILDAYNWMKDCYQSQHILGQFPTLSIYRLPVRDNNRALPQQSICTFSNVDNIEGFIKALEAIKDKKYLMKIDLPKNERNLVMNELRNMGITAGSLFPGFDGICKSLKERYF